MSRVLNYVLQKIEEFYTKERKKIETKDADLKFTIPGTKTEVYLSLGVKDLSGNLAIKKPSGKKYVYGFEVINIQEEPDLELRSNAPGDPCYVDIEHYCKDLNELKQQVSEFWSHKELNIEGRLIKENKTNLKPLVEKLENMTKKKVILKEEKVVSIDYNLYDNIISSGGYNDASDSVFIYTLLGWSGFKELGSIDSGGMYEDTVYYSSLIKKIVIELKESGDYVIIQVKKDILKILSLFGKN